jgi:hypothetical protein
VELAGGQETIGLDDNELGHQLSDLVLIGNQDNAS